MSHAKLIFGHGGGRGFGNSWAELDALLAAHGAVIAHGHITSSWRDRFPGDYGSFGDGPIPHFIAVLRATAEGEVVVCDPMHKGGAVLMTHGDLQAFFKSPVNVFDTAIRLVARGDSFGRADEVSVDSEP
jgi:hypothetical protein